MGIISRTLIRTDRNGTQYYRGLVTCDRCGGLGGSNVWEYTGWTCYKCGGSGKVMGEWSERTPEYEAKLEQRRIARAMKKAEYEKAHAEEIRVQNIARDCEKARLAVATCNDRKHCSCATCEHRTYCNLLTNILYDLEEGEKENVLSESQATVLASLRKVDRTKMVKVETLDGEPCEEGRWFEDAYGNSKRVIVKPNGEKIYTSATTQRGLAKYGLRYTEAWLKELEYTNS